MASESFLIHVAGTIALYDLDFLNLNGMLIHTSTGLLLMVAGENVHRIAASVAD
jgi:hypothetical protein